MNERDMELEIYRRMKLAGMVVARQIAVKHRSADLAFVENNLLTLIECKLTGTAQARRQACAYREHADFAVVVIPQGAWTSTFATKCRDAGLGLGLFDWNASDPYKVMVRPTRTERCRIYQRVITRHECPTQTDLWIHKQLGIGDTGQGAERESAEAVQNDA